MPQESHPIALLTSDDVRQWVAERDDLARQYADLHNKLVTIERKLEALAQLLPENVIAHLLPASSITRNLAITDAATNAQGAQAPIVAEPKAIPVTDAVVAVLASEKGGRTPAYLRERLSQNPDYGSRVKKSPNIVNNALSRLVERNLLIRVDGLYYHPDIYAAIRDGSLDEERQENGASQSFNAVMHRVMMERGGKFTASDAVKVAADDARIGDGPTARVYSWLSREVYRNKLLKEGEFYFYPSKGEEAPDGETAGASQDDEAPTSSTSDDSDFYRLLS